jgi:DNA-binding PadR family transcriptional regulator
MSSGSSGDSSGADPEIIRRKFTLTERQDERLRKLAAAHYGGNSSQCVRSAIEDHARTLDGAGETLLQQLVDDVERMQETLDRVEEHLGEGESESSPSAAGGATTEAQAPVSDELLEGSEAVTEEMWTVYQTLADVYPDGLTINGLVDSSRLSEPAIRHALIDLEQHQYVTSDTVDGTKQYAISQIETL